MFCCVEVGVVGCCVKVVVIVVGCEYVEVDVVGYGCSGSEVVDCE